MPLGIDIVWCHASVGGTLDCGSLLPLFRRQPAGSGRSRLRGPKRQQAAAVQGLAALRRSLKALILGGGSRAGVVLIDPRSPGDLIPGRSNRGSTRLLIKFRITY